MLLKKKINQLIKSWMIKPITHDVVENKLCLGTGEPTHGIMGETTDSTFVDMFPEPPRRHIDETMMGVVVNDTATYVF
ncbi:hypothetical protein Psch_02480 [Pelotomaculum schinkii]|uniref:Uncharacterized protein n=1 Tax=Pelotomaculum schinkii TaxID=78350 RepID=A0A4Y7R9Q0_9FIRM|nr:hypothetical protein Psch_02480 [Pelotomaculum schinkii]